MRTARTTGWVGAAALLFAACDSGGGGTDAGVPDDATGEAEAFEDAATDGTDGPGDDGGEPEADGDGGEDGSGAATFCAPCTWDEECGEGAVCLQFEGLEMSCVPACLVEADCPDGSECRARGAGRYCLPVGDTCVESTLGGPCRSWGCSGRYDRCSDPAGATDGFCTRACVDDADCEPGFNRCADRGDGVAVCLVPLPPPPERCGVEPAASGVGASCAGGTACGGGADRCLSDVDERLPDLCSRACTGAGDCPAGTTCLPVAGTAAAPARYCLPADCSCLARLPGSMLDDGLDALGLDRCDLYYSTASLDRFGPALAHDRFRLPWYDDVHGEWLRGDPFVRETVAALDAAATPRGLLLEAAARQGNPAVDRPFSPTLDPDEPLVEALAALIEHHGGTANRAALRTELTGVPALLQEALAPVAVALDQAATARAAALARIAGSSYVVRDYFNNAASLVLPSLSGLSVIRRQVQDFLIGDFRYGTLFQAAADLLAAAEALDDDRFRGAVGFEVSIDTPLGRFALRDGADTAHAPDDYPGDILFVLDTGGNDTYTIPAGATASPTNPVALAVDLDGADRYGYPEEPSALDVPPRLPSDEDGRYPGDAESGPFSLSTRGRQGSGTLGLGVLLDFGDDGDEYRSLRMSQGWGVLGVGVLYDAGGDDLYLCEAGCQGAAAFGIGIQLDAGEGIDRYEAYHAVQGFAYAKAVGILYDAGGDDRYLAQPDDVLYYNPQDPGRSNSSMAQGMGFGRRSDVELGGDGVFMSGGLAVLRDRAGDDDYECAVFCEGSGYWFGTGILADGAGADHYDARWYVQAGAAHYALAALWDAGGDDVYNETSRRLNVALGGGHDFSSAFLLEDGGDDVYGSPGIALGGGNEDGFGMLADRGGLDSYTTYSNLTLGNAQVDPASGARRTFPTAGIFLDADGDDTYDRPDLAGIGDDALWTQRTHPAEACEYGVGVDRTAGTTGLLE